MPARSVVLVLLLAGCAPAEDLEVGANPGGEPYPESLAQELTQAWESRPSDYQPRTKHLEVDGRPKYTNRLFLESSPYLLQHAHNPVDWHPWGDEAFEKARELGRPVLLSVGYSTCHWCHVMEEESFEDEEVAQAINQNYIAIKVDREVRPDVDAIYMAAVQALTGRGGWPMTVWLTPDREPYYAGTYFPPRDGDRGASVGFLTLLGRMREIYDTRQEDVASNAAILVKQINLALQPGDPGDMPGESVLDALAAHYRERFDPLEGGLAGAPKFPSGMSVRFLLRYGLRSGEANYTEMAALTLEKMALGGIYDQVGGGFHRYSVDEKWFAPHFEKMLYDNALLAVAYLEGFQATGREEFAATARDILAYVGREMTSPEGGFYSATDADSATPEGEREEGYFFTWSEAELKAALSEEQFDQIGGNVSAEGNFEGRNILHGLSLPKSIRSRLYKARQDRTPPLRDDKILTPWNGLMVSAYAFGALVLDEPSYLDRAETAAEFLLNNLRRNGRLLRSYKDGAASREAYLDDYAFLIAGLLDLYEASGDIRWLDEAIGLDGKLEERYEDREAGGFFLTANDHEKLLAREKPGYDGAEPSGNSIQAMNLARLHELTTDDRYRQRAERLFRAFSADLAERPAGLSEMLQALDFHLGETKQVVVVTPGDRAQADPLLAELRAGFAPNRVLAVVSESQIGQHSKSIPLLEGKRSIGGRATAYVCKQRVCKLPTSDPEVFRDQLLAR